MRTRLFVVVITLGCALSVLSVLSACGYRTPLMLPKPDAKPTASAPAPAGSEVK
jgi:predicted small lipoprotein YifL